MQTGELTIKDNELVEGVPTSQIPADVDSSKTFIENTYSYCYDELSNAITDKTFMIEETE